MPKKPDERFPIPRPEAERSGVLDLLGGVARRRTLSGQELLAQEERLQHAAQTGDPDAQAAWAMRLLSEDPNARKNRKALSLLKHAAEKRSALGLFLLGLVHLRGQGLAQNLPAGLRYVEEAAYLGLRDAASLAAKLYAEGLGTDKNPEKALYWARLAGAQGDAVSALEAGRRMLQTSAPDFNEAAKWLAAAAKGAAPGAAFALARLNERRDWSERSSAQARRWMMEAALLGDNAAQYRVGLFYWSGAGGRVDLAEAVRWLCRAAEGGSGKAAAMLAGFAMTGNALPLSRVNAAVLFTLAESLGEPTAKGQGARLFSQLSPAERRQSRAMLAKKTPRAVIEAVIPRRSR